MVTGGPNGFEGVLWGWSPHPLSSTRSKMVMLMRRGWSQGEALTKAFTENAVSWQIKHGGQQSIAGEDTRHSAKRPQLTSNDDTKRQRIIATGRNHGGRCVCKPYNDQRGCDRRESKCPTQAKHCCDALLPSGEVCGATDHTRMHHPNPSYLQ